MTCFAAIDNYIHFAAACPSFYHSFDCLVRPSLDGFASSWVAGIIAVVGVRRRDPAFAGVVTAGCSLQGAALAYCRRGLEFVAGSSNFCAVLTSCSVRQSTVAD